MAQNTSAAFRVEFFFQLWQESLVVPTIGTFLGKIHHFWCLTSWSWQGWSKPRYLIWAHTKNENNPLTKAKPSLERENKREREREREYCKFIISPWSEFLTILRFSLTESLNLSFFQTGYSSYFCSADPNAWKAPSHPCPTFLLEYLFQKNIPPTYWS